MEIIHWTLLVDCQVQRVTGHLDLFFPINLSSCIRAITKMYLLFSFSLFYGKLVSKFSTCKLILVYCFIFCSIL